ncbi:hypothetical protein Patl1_25203 [Pistacia atlantica]|uniref:Uncharacterized protein n=1 Tax=Pistacia atlantica TaxID=434234 RepID=A0ACC1B4P0_9ROSI|nr:hypothetical protein Patl1_25203 [Pistacia atlantica]
MTTLNNIILAALLALLLHIQPGRASRVLHEQVLLNKEIQLQSLQKGSVPPIGGSGCTYIPGTSGPGCPVKEMNVAGDVLHRSGAYPSPMLTFGVATNQ